MAIARLDRALREFRIRGVSTNIAFVENLLKHPTFLDYTYTTKFIDTTPELFHFTARRDRATKILTYIADITVNGHPETAGRPKPPAEARAAEAAGGAARRAAARDAAAPRGARAPRRVADWMLAQEQLLITDTTMRDGHQSLLATRMRSYDMIRGGAGLRPHAAAALQRRMLGRRDLRRRLPLPAGMPVAAAARPARARCRT